MFTFLNTMREGNTSMIDKKTLSALQTPLIIKKPNDKIVPTELHSKNEDVDKKNEIELNKLKYQEVHFESVDEVKLSQEYKEHLLKEYELDDIMEAMPLFASVEKSPPPPNLTEHYKKLKAQKGLKREFENENGAISVVIEKKIDELNLQIKTIEWEEKVKSTITLSSIRTFLSNTSPNKYENAEEIFKRYQQFQKQLTKDFLALQNHSKQTFFDKHYPVRNRITLKEEAQVMLLWNLDVSAKVANGSRGIIVSFLALDDYHYLLQKESKKRVQEKLKREKEFGESEKNIIDIDLDDLEVDVMFQEINMSVKNMEDQTLGFQLETMDKVLMGDIQKLPYVEFCELKTFKAVEGPLDGRFL